MSENENKEKERIRKLIRGGSEIAGGAIGGALGFLAGGPVFAAGAGALGASIPILADVANRSLSRRERIRVGATATFALVKIKSYLDSGYTPREDGFFNKKKNRRSNAEEILEGVLLKARNEHEEKKAKILGNIFANIAFWPGFSVSEANHLLRIASELTYRQICVLSLIKRKYQISGIKLREDYYREFKGTLLYETVSILQEIYELYNLGLVACKNKTGESYNVLLELSDVAPNRLVLNALGERYYEVMGLEDISEEDIKEVAKYLE